MVHKITFEIESEKEWAAICSLSALIGKPVSEIAKNDLIEMTKYTAERIKEDTVTKKMINGSKYEKNTITLLSILEEIK